MSSDFAPADERPIRSPLGGRVHDALVGRHIDPNFSIVLRWLNLAAFVIYFLALLWYMLGAAMTAGTATPAMRQWLTAMLWVLATGAAACLYTGVLLAARDRWPRGVQYLAVAALVAVVLLNIFAPPGINSPRRGA